jgi:fused signal recognition particle receptor
MMFFVIVLVVVAAAVGAYFAFGRTPSTPALPEPREDDAPPKVLPSSAAAKAKEAGRPAASSEGKAARAEDKATKAEAKPEPVGVDVGAEASQRAAPAPAPAERVAAPAASEPADAAPAVLAQAGAASAAAGPAVAAPAVVAQAAVAVKVAAPAPTETESRERVAILKKGLATTRGGFIARLAQIFSRKKEIDPALLDEMQAVLITADIGPRTADKLLERLRARLGQLRDTDAVWAALSEEGRQLVQGTRSGGIAVGEHGRPTTILVVGVNGVGKTTTIGKLASHFKQDGKKVVLAAGDTFRAAAVLQLEVWAKRVGCELVKGKDRADPSSVIFDAVKKAKADGLDVVIADTAGRLHTKSNLMEELKKVVRTAEKALERPVDEILLVLDATTGQNAIQQAQLFKEAIPVSGIVLTKLDGTAKGGVVLGIVDEHRVPVRYIGIGERVEDLREFDPDSFVRALFEKPDEEPAVQA